MIENETTEFKREFVEKIKKTVIAFLNTKGGTIYVGIEDNGNVVGISNPDNILNQISSCLKDGISPDSIGNYSISPITIDDKIVIKIEVNQGSLRPYFLKGKGLKPENVFIRSGATTVSVSDSKLREIIKEGYGDSYVESVSLNQNLTFDYASKVFGKSNIGFDENNKITPGIKKPDGVFTNLGLLLSDQCEHSIKCAIFSGTSRAIFKDCKEISGSLFKQLEETYNYLNVFNKIASDFVELKRIDKPDYPPIAIKEALTNAIIHRDYSYSGSILVSLYDDRLEITSLGGIVDGVNLDLMKIGISQSRNTKLVQLFYRLKYVEAYGTGIPRIFELYNGSDLEPEIPIVNGGFTIKLPNINYIKENITIDSKKECVIKQPITKKYSANFETKLLKLKNNFNNYFSVSDATKILNISNVATNKFLHELEANNKATSKSGVGKELLFKLS